MARQSGWNSIVDLQDTGRSVSDGLDGAFNNIDLSLNEVEDKANTAINALNLTSKPGVNIDTILDAGVYFVDTNLPLGGTAELRVGFDTTLPTRIIQQIMYIDKPIITRRQTVNAGVNWTAPLDTAQSEFNIGLALEVQNTYTREQMNSLLIENFSGTVVPAQSLGKNGDNYERFIGKTTSTVITGTCEESYNELGFTIYEASSPTDPSIQNIFIHPDSRGVYVAWGSDGVPALDNPILKLGGGTVELTITFIGASGFDATYDLSDETIVAAVIGGTTLFEGITDIFTDKKGHYLKANGEWFYQPVFNVSYDFETVGISDGGAIVITSKIPAFTSIAQLTTDPRDMGIYQITFSMTFLYNSTNKSAHLQFSLNGGQSWEEFRVEPKDLTDRRAMTYSFPMNRTVSGPFDLRLQGGCESTGDELTVEYASIIVERKA